MIIAVTDRWLCPDGLIIQIERIARAEIRVGRGKRIIRAIVLREKDLNVAAYETLARACLDVCAAYGLTLVLHGRASLALRLGVAELHLPGARLADVRAFASSFQELGVSVHAACEAQQAAAAGATRLFAGHVFPSGCKSGIPPRGLDFLSRICALSSVPVYAIGGIDATNACRAFAAGAAGVCMMSALMSPEKESQIERLLETVVC